MDILKKYKNPWLIYEQEIPHSRFCEAEVGCSPAEKLSPKHLQLLRDAFTSSKHKHQTRAVIGRRRRTRDPDGGHKIALGEFCEVMGFVMGSDANDEWVRRFFDEVDISRAGQVTWPQLCSYLLLEYTERSRASVPASALQDSQLVFRHCTHNKREPTVRVVAVFHSPSLRYISVSKGGQITLWNKNQHITKSLKLAGDPTEEVAHTKRFRGWVTDAVYMSNVQKAAVATDCRDIHFINVSTANAFEDFHLYGFPCVLTAICYWYDIQYPFEPSLLLVGDEMGGVHVLRFLNPTRRLFNNVTISKREHGLQRIYLHHLRDHEGTVTYRYIPGVHQDPVNRIMFESGTKVIMTSSESSVTSVAFFNMSGKPNQYIWKVRGGVTCFDYNARLQLIVTGSSDCAVRMWARYVTARPLATLQGHHATVLDVAIYQPVEQIFSYSRDAELRVWDITTHECLKTVRLHFPCLQAAQIPEHGNFPLLLLSPPLPDETRPHLLVGCKDYLALLSLSDKQRGGSRAGALAHQLGECRVKAVLSCALYNPSLQQVVTGSTDSTVCVWELNTGKKRLHISNAHGEEELSCMTLDSSQRRLITGAHNGTIKVWNLLNGLNLHKLEPLRSTVTGLLWVHGDHLVAVGLTHCIVEYDLATSEDLHVKAKASWKSSIRQQSDITALCHCPAMDVIATATQGEVIVWKLETQMPVLHLSKETSSGGVPSVDCLMFLQHRALNQSLRHKGVLVSSQAGFICFWSITGEKHTYGHFYAPEQSDERVLALSSNQSEHTLLVSGDTLGWLQVWDIAHYGLDVQDQVVSERPPLLRRWRAHSGALLSVEVLEMAERVFILSASDDGSAGLWTVDGDHVGSFGQEVLWNLTDPCTFQADSDTRGSLTEERRDKTRRPSLEPCGSGQTSQGDSPCGKIEQEHQGPQPAMCLKDDYCKTGASRCDRRFVM